MEGFMPLGFRLRHCGMCVRVVIGVVEKLIAALKVQGFHAAEELAAQALNTKPYYYTLSNLYKHRLYEVGKRNAPSCI